MQLIPSRVRDAVEPAPRRLCFQRAHSHEPVPVEHCYISDELINELIQRAPWDAFALGTWQRLSTVEIRVVPGAAAQITLFGGRRPSGEEVDRFLRGAVHAVPQLQGLFFAPRRGDPLRRLWGTSILTFPLAGEELEVPAGTFVQVNLGAAEKLVQRSLEWLDPQPDDAVLDVFAGAGTFTLPLARRAAAAIAVEQFPPAAAALSENAARAGLTNVQVQTAPAEQALPRLKGEVDLVLVDPPRRGCAPDVLEALVRLAPRRILYVSCEPSTLARDLRRLADSGYALVRSGVVDLFPQTYSLESVTLLERFLALDHSILSRRRRRVSSCRRAAAGGDQPAAQGVEQPVGGGVQQQAELVGPEAVVAEAVGEAGALEVLDPVLRLAAVDVPVVEGQRAGRGGW